jgi:hypothetical protein
MVDVVALFAAILEFASYFPPGRVTVKERYEMKKKVVHFEGAKESRNDAADVCYN